MSIAGIGARLNLIEGTVKARVIASVGELAVRNRVKAAIAAYEAGLTGRDG
ncbi:hypothetical protein [Streptomyces sp. NPDC059639]|uniref:hypothetical protein n=1 Tax=Streptomyces sp. NPDC059639 TaxID=3346891 RepID=UPI00368AB9B7